MGEGSCFTGSWTLKNKTPEQSSTKLWMGSEEAKCVYRVKVAMLLKLYTHGSHWHSDTGNIIKMIKKISVSQGCERNQKAEQGGLLEKYKFSA